MTVPSKSVAQRKFMRIAAHSPAFAAKAGIPQKIAKDFNRADIARQAFVNALRRNKR
jgi:hypothetical protein